MSSPPSSWPPPRPGTALPGRPPPRRRPSPPRVLFWVAAVVAAIAVLLALGVAVIVVISSGELDPDQVGVRTAGDPGPLLAGAGVSRARIL